MIKPVELETADGRDIWDTIVAASAGDVATLRRLLERDPRLARADAFDSRTGKELWAVPLDYNVTAIPISYMGRNGKQYVAVVAATNGQGNNESLHVFALP